MGYLLAVVLISVVVTVYADGHGSRVLPPYRLGKQVRSAPIILYGEDVTSAECEGHPMRRNVELKIHAVVKDGGFLLHDMDSIHIGEERNSTENDTTKIPCGFNSTIITFVRKTSDSSVTYDWYEEMGYMGLHEGDLEEISGFCGLMSDSHGIAYRRCPYECPPKKFLYNGQCIYNMKAEAASYSDAVQVCDEDGASLASLDMGSFSYFKECIGSEFFWIDNSYSGGESEKPVCNATEEWDDVAIQMGGENNMIVVTEEGFCVPSGDTKAGALCSIAASPYVARPYENEAPTVEELSFSFEATGKSYGHCCQTPKPVSPMILEVNLNSSQSVGAAYMLEENTYRPTIADASKYVVLIFEDSGHMESKGGQVNPYLVSLSIESEGSERVEHYPYHPIVPEGSYSMSYNLFVIKVSEVIPDRNYSTHDCGEELRGRCFFHLNQFLEDIGGSVITRLQWGVHPDVSTMERVFRYDVQHAGKLCQMIYDVQPNEHGFILCDSPMSGSESLHIGVTWILGLVLTGYLFVYRG